MLCEVSGLRTYYVLRRPGLRNKNLCIAVLLLYRLFPFIWGEFVSKGQLYGNRKYRNFVNITNPYSFSYPGYNDLFTGFADSAINTNHFPDNPNPECI